MPCPHDIVPTLCRVETASCQHDVLSRRCGAKTVSCQHCVMSRRYCAKTAPFCDDTVSRRCRVRNVVAQQQRRFDTTPPQDGAVSKRFRIKAMPCQNGVVTTWCRANQSDFMSGIRHIKTVPCHRDTVSKTVSCPKPVPCQK